MRSCFSLSYLCLGLALCSTSQGRAADVYGLEQGNPEIQSAGQLAFGPDGILFVGDSKGAAVFAIATGDKSGHAGKAEFNIEDVTEKLGRQLGAKPDDVKINDLAVNPASGNIYLSLTLEGNQPALVKITADGAIKPVALENIAFSKTDLPDAPKDEVIQSGRGPRNLRDDAITDLAFVDGQLLISGLSSKEAPSSVRTVPFPFSDQTRGASLEIYHGAHGRSEDYAPVRTFVPFTIDGKPNLLAGFQCTPLVKFPLDELAKSSKVEGTTVAELGNRNRPLDMVVYKKDGKNYLLISNSARGVMKVPADGIANQQPISEPVRDGATAGLEYETIGELQGVEQLDRLNDGFAIVLVKDGDQLNLTTVAFP